MLTALAAITSVGCKKKSEGQTTTPSIGVVSNSDGMFVRANPPEKVRYYIHKNGDFSAPCTIMQSDTGANRNISCTLEVEELEGYFHGIDMYHNIPSDMCYYFVHKPYYYFSRPYGRVASSFTYTKTGTTVTAVGGGNTISRMGSNEQVTCDTDYTKAGGPNCCYGNYTVTATIDGVTNTNTYSYPGAIGNCADGPATRTQEKDGANIPLDKIYFVQNTGINSKYTIDSPLKLKRAGNFFYANYYDPADGIPIAFTQSTFGGQTAWPSNMYYEYICLDSAQEVLASITVQIREWNESKEFDKKSSGNPDSTGTEPVFGTPINDIKDWKDALNLGSGYPAVFPSGFPASSN